MPAVSKSQQALFGMAYAVRKGEMKRSEVDQKVLDIVDSDMTTKQIKDFASTPTKGLKESLLDALDDKKLNDMTNDAIHAELSTARKRLRSRKYHGKTDVLGNPLKPGDVVLFVLNTSFTWLDIQICSIIEKTPEGWVSDITVKEAIELFENVSEDEILDDFEVVGDHLVIANNYIVCKVNTHSINKIK